LRVSRNTVVAAYDLLLCEASWKPAPAREPSSVPPSRVSGLTSPRAQRAGAPSLRSGIEERAVFGMPGGVARHKGTLRDHSFPVASQRFENAMRQSRSVSQAQRFHSVKHVAVDHWTGIPAYASDERRLAIPGNVRVWLAFGHTDMWGASRVSRVWFRKARSVIRAAGTFIS